ncbi:hypothetical protein CPB86DRAFT_813083 [Serendipita vermifera]|nr:hypothetical protein CPB86DRAFT_813083 [Serendipita vermifera]
MHLQSRRYAGDLSDLMALADKIEKTPSRPANKASMPTPPGMAHSQAAKTPPKPISRPPEDFVAFYPRTPYNPYEFLPENRRPPSYRRYRDQAGPPRPLAVREDIFHQLDLDPLNEQFNCSLISSYTTSMGRIQQRGETRLTRKNQRKIGKAIRRARAMGLIPTFSQWSESMVKIK